MPFSPSSVPSRLGRTAASVQRLGALLIDPYGHVFNPVSMIVSINARRVAMIRRLASLIRTFFPLWVPRIGATRVPRCMRDIKVGLLELLSQLSPPIVIYRGKDLPGRKAFVLFCRPFARHPFWLCLVVLLSNRMGYENPASLPGEHLPGSFLLPLSLFL